MKEKKTKHFDLRLRPSMFEKLEGKALEEVRSINQTIELAIEQYVNKKK